MSGSEEQSDGEGEELFSKTDEIMDKKGYATSVIWKWFGYLKGDDAQTKTVCKICHWDGKHNKPFPSLEKVASQQLH